MGVTEMNPERLLMLSCAATTFFLVLKAVVLSFVTDKQVISIICAITIIHHISLLYPLHYGASSATLRSHRFDIIMTRVLTVWYGLLLCAAPAYFVILVIATISGNPWVSMGVVIFLFLLFVSLPVLVEFLILRELSRRLQALRNGGLDAETGTGPGSFRLAPESPHQVVAPGDL
jgi:hypothetical protein